MTGQVKQRKSVEEVDGYSRWLAQAKGTGGDERGEGGVESEETGWQGRTSCFDPSSSSLLFSSGVIPSSPTL